MEAGEREGRLMLAPIVYFCARYSRHAEMNAYAERLRLLGYIVRCEWITGAHHDTDSARCAEIDIDEVTAADIVISFTEPPGEVKGRGRGGRHVEFGFALQGGKRMIVVGYRENVFHHMPEVEFYEDAETLMERLKMETGAA